MGVADVGTTKVTSTRSSRKSVARSLFASRPLQRLLHILWLVLLLLLVDLSVAHAATDMMVLQTLTFKNLLVPTNQRYGGPARMMAWISPRSSWSSPTATTAKITAWRRHKSLHGPGPRHGSSTTTPFETEERNPTLPRRVAIVGGGLAGLSTAYHLLQKTAADCTLSSSSCLDITILDPAMVGMAGASSVAGG
jgi:hypothetical protein